VSTVEQKPEASLRYLEHDRKLVASPTRQRFGVGRESWGFEQNTIETFIFAPHGYFARQRLAFVPPNPKLFVSAALTVCFWAVFGT